MSGGRERRTSPRPITAMVVTAVAVAMWSACPGTEAVPDSELKIACEDMTPRHPGYVPQNWQHVPCPYRLLVDTVPVRPGDLVNLTLVSIDDSIPFKGFMVQARDADGYALGTFLPDCSKAGTKPQHMISCSKGNEPYNAVVHSNNKNKLKAFFTWVAPISIKGPLIFKYTVVHDYKHFWTNEETAVIPVLEIPPEEYAIKSSINHEYYIYQMFIKNCYS
ncbi:putative defense protein 1 [Sipha flava]|uniref:Defense protein 1 n=1 Tax=Sipha flava TaxID=143950 RepID=A0A2S2Q3R8_9HEMI|nr:putative defense protein 1 [Sipha flava]XP_025419499.1 putative defense protein 1 [Sipha flava]XP_025419500.1 putative defense protein 1 [Sipha flava]